MKITVEVPDMTLAGFVNYVYMNEDLGFMLGTTSISTEMIKEGRVVCKGADGYEEQ